MADTNQQDIDIVNTLIAKTLDSAEGYREAARDEETGRYRDTFLKMADERDAVVNHLQTTVQGLGGTPKERGSILGSMHRTFTFFSAITTKGDDTLIKRVEGGEDSLRDAYRDALEKDMDAVTRQAVTEANISVMNGHRMMSDLKHLTEV